MSDFLASKLFLAAVLLVLLVIGFVTMLLVNRYLHVATEGGDRLMRGRAARHVELLSRTLVVRSDPESVTAVVGPVMADHSRWVLFEPTTPVEGEHAAWASTSHLTPGLPRMAVRPSPAPGLTEFGVVSYAWWSRFPQGGRFVKRVVEPARKALGAAGLPVVEHRRHFAPHPAGRTADGPRLAREFDAAALAGTGAALDAPTTASYEKRARRGETLAPQAGRADVDAELMTLLLDPEDTLVTRRTADALMARRDVVGLRLVLVADLAADEDTSRWLWSAVGGRRAAALGRDDGPLLRDLEQLAQTDPDPRIRDLARQFVRHVYGRTP